MFSERTFESIRRDQVGLWKGRSSPLTALARRDTLESRGAIASTLIGRTRSSVCGAAGQERYAPLPPHSAHGLLGSSGSRQSQVCSPQSWTPPAPRQAWQAPGARGSRTWDTTLCRGLPSSHARPDQRWMRFGTSPPALPTHTPGPHGPSPAPHLCVSLVAHSDSHVAGAAHGGVGGIGAYGSPCPRSGNVTWVTLPESRRPCRDVLRLARCRSPHHPYACVAVSLVRRGHRRALTGAGTALAPLPGVARLLPSAPVAL